MPDLRTYLNACHFLQDYYHEAKQQRADFSYENWAQQLGVTSKSYLRFAVIGKRKISETLLQKFTSYFNFDEKEAEYFLILVLHSQCKVDTQKKIYAQKLIQLMRIAHQAPAVVTPSENVMANPLALVLRNLLSFGDFKKTPERLAQIMGLPLTEIENLLNQLSQDDLAVLTPEGWQSVHDSVKISSSSDRAAIRTYHRRCLQKAIESQELAIEERYFRGLNVALSEVEYKAYLQELNEFLQKTFIKYHTDQIHQRRIYQVNLTLFPWTRSVDVLNE